jgi:hypothetical protein
MATVRIPIIGWNACPDATGEVIFTDYRVVAAGDWHTRQVVRFGVSAVAQLAVNAYLYGSFAVPWSYVGGGKFFLVWTAGATTGDVYWVLHCSAVGGDDTEVLGTNFVDVQFTDSAPSAPHNRLEFEMVYASGSAASFAPGDEVLYELIRVGSSAGDTLVGPALVFGCYFQFEDA